VEPDILDQLTRDFPSTAVPGLLVKLRETTKSPRLQRCIVFAAHGHPWLFDYLCRLTKVDHRDVIMTAEYWRGDSQLGLYDFNKPIPRRAGKARTDRQERTARE
jgi:hypothetical protein